MKTSLPTAISRGRLPEPEPVPGTLASATFTGELRATDAAARSVVPEVVADSSPRAPTVDFDAAELAAQRPRSIFQRGAPSSPKRDAAALGRQSAEQSARLLATADRQLDVVRSWIDAIGADSASDDEWDGQLLDTVRITAADVPRPILVPGGDSEVSTSGLHPSERRSALHLARARAGSTTIAMRATPTGSAASVEMRHPRLGCVRLEIRIDNDRMSVAVEAASETAALAIESSVDDLRSALRRRGMDLQEFRTRVTCRHAQRRQPREEESPT